MVHAFELNGYYIALDVNSGSIHCLDRVTYDIIGAINNHIMDNPMNRIEETSLEELKNTYGQAIVDEAYDEILDLMNEELLFSEELNEVELLAKLDRDTGIKALCLHAAHDCNLGCEYCFASKGDYATNRALMSYDIACKALDFLAANSGTRRNIEVDFFGGEPLLNFDVIKRTVEYGRELEKRVNKKFHFTITTNGTILNDEIKAFINENMDNVVISLDGRKEVNDAMRPYRGGQGSYDNIVKNSRELVDSRGGKQYYIRGTFTTNNLDFSEDVFHIANLGFKEVSIEPVVGTGEPFHLSMDDMPKVLDEYESLTKDYIEYLESGKELNYYHFNINLYDGPCIHRRIVACGAGFEYLAVSPEGDIYPCHQFVGQPEFIMGNVKEGIHNPKLGTSFKDCNILTKKECRDCWAKYFCSGGCHANAYFSNKDIGTPNEMACIMQKKRIECAIMIAMARAGL